MRSEVASLPKNAPWTYITRLDMYYCNSKRPLLRLANYGTSKKITGMPAQVDRHYILLGSPVFLAVNFIYYSIKRIQKDVKGLVLLSGVIFILLLGLGYIFMLMFGIVGVGYACVVSCGIGAVIGGVMVRREKGGV